MKKNIIIIMLVLGLTVGLVSVSAAVPITQLDGTWQDPVGGANVVISNGTDPRTIRWGSPLPSPNRSGYDWSPRATEFNAPTDGSAFSLGTFNHHNFVIPDGSAITGVDMKFSMTVNGLPIPTVAGLIHFNHNETPNGSVPGGVPDIVTISSLIIDMNVPFDFLGAQYNFTLLGFSKDGGVTIDTQFITAENADNIADLYGRITAVPEPATMLLLGSGLIGLAGFARRKFRK